MTRRSPHPPLGLTLPEKELYALGRFYPGARNQVALDTARAFAEGRLGGVLTIAGKPASGKTHLLKGIFHASGENGVFLAAPALLTLDRENLDRAFSRAQSSRLVCLDALDAEEAADRFYQRIYSLFNALTGSGGLLAVTMRATPARAPHLPDYLSSRLLSGLVVTLQRPDEDELKAILRKVAADRAITLTPRAEEFILSHSRRAVGELVALVDRLEHALPAGARRIGLQLIRSVIQSNHR